MLASGFGVGYLPRMPGTYGTILGLIWFCLLAFLPLRFFIAILFLSIPFGIWICGEAEKILKTRDPPCVVLDEIIAMPFAAIGLWESIPFKIGTANSLLWLWMAFLAFRFFDIVKPFPVNISQRLPRGWGMVADDLAAAAYVAMITFSIRWLIDAM